METSPHLLQDQSFVKVATVGKSFGTNGFNKIRLFESFEKIAKKQDFLFLNLDSTYVPFRVISWKQSHSMVRFDDIITQQQADNLNGVGVYLPEHLVGHLSPDIDLPYVGFTILDREERIGDIIEVYEMPQQLLALVEYDGREIYIPLVEELILEVNEDEEYLVMDLPDGILDL